jgi:5-methylcytosine-specific restriction enzyme A
VTRNLRPPRHRPAHARSKTERLAQWRRFSAAFNPRPNRIARGYDDDWRQLRRLHLAEHPYCRHCAEAGRGEVRATVVDHIETVRDHPERRLDPENLQSLCVPCHNAKTSRGEGGFGRPRRAPG